MLQILRGIFVLIPLSMMLSACGSKSNDAPANSPRSARPMQVDGVVVHPQRLENIVRSSGTVLASESVDLIAEASGRVDSISFVEGRHVRKDELLVKLNDEDLQAQLRKIQLQIDLATEQERRQKQLFGKSLVSSEQYDIALNQLNTLKADRDNLIASIRKREIRAPFDGVIGLRYVSKGGYLTQTTHIASIQKINPLKVDFSIPEKYAGRVAVGDSVDVRNDETKLHLTGRLAAIEPAVDPAMGTLQLRAVCNNTSDHIFPGAYVEITLKFKQNADALMVPTQAIIPVIKGQTVLVRRNGVVVSVPVKTGIRTPSSVEITSGLSDGDTVITTGIMQLRPGNQVTVEIK